MPRAYKPGLGAGDAGFTSLFGGRRVPKTHPRVLAGALLDDLSCLLGAVKAGARAGLKKELAAVQRQLFRAAGFIAGAANAGAVRRDAAALEAFSGRRAAGLPPLKEFVLPGRNRKDALVHLARSRARLCELLAWRLKARPAAVYLNRLSDYLFILARKA